MAAILQLSNSSIFDASKSIKNIRFVAKYTKKITIKTCADNLPYGLFFLLRIHLQLVVGSDTGRFACNVTLGKHVGFDKK